MKTVIPAEEVVALCSEAPILVPEVDDYCMFKLKAGVKYHVQMRTVDVYLMTSDNYQPLFCHNHYLGVIMVCVRNDCTKIYDFDVRQYFIRSNVLVVSDAAGESIISPVGMNGDILCTGGDEKYLRQHFERRYHDLFMENPKQFEQRWQNFLCVDRELHRTANGFAF